MQRFLCLLLSGCFAEPPTVEGTSESSSSEASMHDSSSTSSTTTDESGTSLQTEDETTDAESTSTGTATTGEDCQTIDVPVDGLFGGGDMMELQLDFDTLPGSPGKIAELCIMFGTDNPASARTIMIKGQLLTFGPCGSKPAPTYLLCAEYIKPAGVTDVLLNNTTVSGCQNGSMDDVGLVFGCVGET